MNSRRSFAIAVVLALATINPRLSRGAAASPPIITVAGTGVVGPQGDGGLAALANLSQPDGLAFDGRGNLYVADQGNNTIRQISPSGVITLVAGIVGSSGFGGDGGLPLQTVFNAPRCVAFDQNFTLYIADTANNRIRYIQRNGTVATLAGTGVAGYGGDGGLANQAALNAPRGLAFDTSGNLYVADTGNHRIRMITPNGLISTVAGGTQGFGGDGGPAIYASLNSPRGLAFDGLGNLLVADSYNNRIRKISTTGVISTVAGTGAAQYGGDGGLATAATLNAPRGVAFDAGGNLYIGDQGNNTVRRVSPAGIISTVAGNGVAGYGGDGAAASAAKLFQPGWLAIDRTGNLFVSDLGNSRIREVDGAGPSSIGAQGVIRTVAGTGAMSGTGGDGGPATAALLTQPDGIAFDANGNLYIADQGNNTVRMVTAASLSLPIIPGNYIRTIAGTGTAGYGGDGGPATSAMLNSPHGLTFDPAGNLYIADTSNNAVRMVAPSGTITTVFNFYAAPRDVNYFAGKIYVAAANLGAANGNNIGEFDASGSVEPLFSLNVPVRAIAIDPSGNLYMALNDFNSTGGSRVSMAAAPVTANETIAVFAGTGTAGYTGDQIPASTAELNEPRGVVIDPFFGNLYISDYANHRVRKVGANGLISTVAGNGTATFSGDGGPATTATLNDPTYAAFDGYGNLFISDLGNHVVREVFGGAYPQTINTAVGSSVNVAPIDGTTALQPANINFAAITAAGITSVTTGITAPATPNFMASCTPALTLDISTTASFAGGATVCITPSALGSMCSQGTSLWHYTSGAWQPLPPPSSTPQGQVCGVTNSFSPFAVLAPIPAGQSINFPAIAAQSLNAGSAMVSATATSGLLVNFTALTPSVCSVTNTTVTLLTSGTCTIAADQFGNATYAAATEVTQSFAVNSGFLSQSISFPSIGNSTLSASPVTLTATATSGLPVVFSSLTPSTCAVSGNTAMLLSAGTCTIDANQAGNAAYAPAPDVTQSFTILALIAQTISFPSIGTQALSGGSVTVSPTASSGLPVSLNSQTSAVCSVSGFVINFLSSGVCTVTATQPGNGTYAAASSVIQMFSIAGGTQSQTITFAPIGNQLLASGTVRVVASASSGLPVTISSLTAGTCSAAGYAVSLLAAGTCMLQATQPGNATFAAAAPVSQGFAITAGSGVGSNADSATDGPLPPWALLTLGAVLLGRRRVVGSSRR